MKRIYKFFISIAIGLLVETVVFNVNSFISIRYKEIKDLNVYYDASFSEIDGSYLLDETCEYSTIEIYDIGREVKNVYIDFDVTGGDGIVKVDYLISDEGNDSLYLGNSSNDGVVWNNNLRSTRYANINAYGNVNKIMVKINKDFSEVIKINEITLNRPREISFSIVRFLFATLFVFFCFCIFGKNNILNYRLYNVKPIVKKTIIVVLIAVQLVTGFVGSRINNTLVKKGTNDQYAMLTNSLLEGRVNIDYPVSDELINMENPYDHSMRYKKGVDYPWDTAYYNGNYYVYFGVAPVISFYLPYKALTGYDFPDWMMNFISFSVLSIAIILIIFKVAEKQFNKVPVVFIALSSIFAIDTCGSLTILTEPRIYTVPILYALAAAMMGICLWIYSIRTDGTLNSFLIFFGSSFMALVIGSRPQLILFAFVSIAIFFDYLKEFKKNCLSVIIALIPFLVIGSGIAYYNYIRFGSFLDFGASYNLTFNDMTRRGFKIDRIYSGISYYLTQPFALTEIFPFIQTTQFESNYIGMFIEEYSVGGLFFINPITCISLFTVKFKNFIKSKIVYVVSIALTFCGVLITLVDTQFAGQVERYMADISIFFILSSLIVVFGILNESKHCEHICKVFIIFVLFALVFSVLRVFAYRYLALDVYNSELFYNVYGLIQFWL